MFGRRRHSIYGLIISVFSVFVLFDRFDSVQGSLSSRNPDNDNVLTETRRHNRRQETRNEEEEATIDAAVKKQRRLLSIPGVVITKLSTGGVAMFRFTRRQYKTVVDSTLVWTIGVLQSIQDRLNKSIENNKIHEDNNTSTEQKQETKSNIVVAPSNDKSSVPANRNDEPIVVVVKHEKAVEETNTHQDKTTAATIGSPAATLRSGSILPKSSSTASSVLHNNNNSKNKNKLKAIVDKTGTASASSSSSSVFDAPAAPPHAIILDHDSDEDTVLDPEPSYLGSFFPTLMTGLVFATAGTMSYLWNGDWTETASSVASYFWGTAEDATTEDIGGTLDSSSAIPVTPDKY